MYHKIITNVNNTMICFNQDQTGNETLRNVGAILKDLEDAFEINLEFANHLKLFTHNSVIRRQIECKNLPTY